MTRDPRGGWPSLGAAVRTYGEAPGAPIRCAARLGLLLAVGMVLALANAGGREPCPMPEGDGCIRSGAIGYGGSSLGGLFYSGFGKAFAEATGGPPAALWRDPQTAPVKCGGEYSDAGSELRKPVSPLKAVAASLLIPGLGQLATGHKGRAKVFMAAEAAILVCFATFQVQGHVRMNRYIDYAELFAGVADAGGMEDWYYRNLGQYHSSADYVKSIARTARAMYGDDLEQRNAYIARYSPPADEIWNWRSEADRRDFLEQRKDSRNSFRRSDQMLGLALLNRVLSAVDAARLARGARSKQSLYAHMAVDGTSYVGLRWVLH